MQRGLKSDLGSKTVVQFEGKLRFFGKNLKELLSDTNQKYIEKVKIANTRVHRGETKIIRLCEKEQAIIATTTATKNTTNNDNNKQQHQKNK